MPNTFATFQRFPRDIRLYTLAWGFLGFGYFGIFGVLFNLYLLRLGYGPETIGLLVGAGQLLWGVGAIPAGMVGARIGNRNAIVWGMSIFTLTTILLLCAEWLPVTFRTGWIATWWISSWVGSSLMIVNGTPYLMEVCTPGDRRAVFTVQQAALGLCGFAGSLAAGVLPGLFSTLTGTAMDTSTIYWYALWLAPLSYIGATLLMGQTLRRPPVLRVAQGVYSAKIPLFVIALIGLLTFLQASGEGTIRAFFNVYLDSTLDVSISRIGAVMGIGQFLPVLSALAAPLVMARWGTGRTIILFGVVMALFMLILAFFANWLAASIGYIGILATISISAIARNLFSQEIVAPQWRTAMSVAFTIGLALGWSSAAGLGGYVITAFGYRTLFMLAAIMAAGSGLLLWAYLRTGAATNAAATSPVDAVP